jgi:phosphoglycolate phosphatase-like HAD superfamily hydrolase
MPIRTNSTAITLVLLGVGVLAGSPDLAANAGTLVFEPGQPRAGEHVEVSYRPDAKLAGEATLHLRTRLRTARDGAYNTGMGSIEAARLEVGADGVARGAFRVPRDIVYAAFAIENPGASRTDSREGRFWELLVHDAEGRPLLEALEQRFNDHMGRDMSEVLATARAMTHLYPDAPLSWSALRAAEGWVGSTDDEEARNARHLARVVALDRRLREAPSPSAADVGNLFFSARVLGAEEIASYWRRRLLAEHSTSFFAVQERLSELYGDHGEDPEEFVAALEPVWESAADQRARRPVVTLGFQFARQSGDPEAILRWVDRYITTEPAHTAWALATVAGNEATREQGIRRLRAAIQQISQTTDFERALGQTAAEYRAQVALQVAELRAALGDALLSAGRAPEATIELEQATATGWNADWLRSLAEARLAAGDNSSAVSALAAAAADPATDESTADSLRAAANVSAETWAAEVERAKRAMLERTLAEARDEYVGSPSARRPGGREVQLTELLGPEATIVVFWSRYCGASLAAMPRIAAVADRLADMGIPTLAVTNDPHEDALAYLDDGGFKLDVLFDDQCSFGQALNNWGTPQYYVLDGKGRLRFVSSLDAVLRHVMALREPL